MVRYINSIKERRSFAIFKEDIQKFENGSNTVVNQTQLVPIRLRGSTVPAVD